MIATVNNNVLKTASLRQWVMKLISAFLLMKSNET